MSKRFHATCYFFSYSSVCAIPSALQLTSQKCAVLWLSFPINTYSTLSCTSTILVGVEQNQMGILFDSILCMCLCAIVCVCVFVNPAKACLSHCTTSILHTDSYASSKACHRSRLLFSQSVFFLLICLCIGLYISFWIFSSRLTTDNSHTEAALNSFAVFIHPCIFCCFERVGSRLCVSFMWCMMMIRSEEYNERYC